jgi:hypothetical protein
MRDNFLKESLMAKHIFFSAALVLLAIFIGCRTAPSESREPGWWLRQAADLTKEIGNPDFMRGATSTIVSAEVSLGMLDDAKAAAGNVKDPRWKYNFFRQIINRQMGLGDQSGASRTFEEALHFADAIDTPEDKVDFFLVAGHYPASYDQGVRWRRPAATRRS